MDHINDKIADALDQIIQRGGTPNEIQISSDLMKQYKQQSERLPAPGPVGTTSFVMTTAKGLVDIVEKPYLDLNTVKIVGEEFVVSFTISTIPTITTLAEYREAAMETADYPHMGNNLTYTILGLGGEAGEAQEHYKKAIRENYGAITPERRQAILKELGDNLWYITLAAYELDSTLEEVANMNIAKLRSRQERGTLHGDGDNR